jgi:hypothetical protein
VVILAAASVWIASGREEDRTGPVGRLSVAVDPSTISASASSEFPATRRQSFGIDNTLDGKPDTAWSHGTEGPGVGETLTYRLSEPVQLTSIRLITGSAGSDASFSESGRIREARVTTDAGSMTTVLRDSRLPQEVQAEFGVTSVVTLEVLSVYPGARFSDLAHSEIEFLAASVK